MGKPGYNGGYRREAQEMLRRSSVCVHCGVRPATEADHSPPLSLHRHVPGSGCCRLLPSCYQCARIQGGMLGGFPQPAPRVELVEPPGFDRRSDVWDVPWLKSLRGRVPRDATWPRLMTVPHPRAVDSLGAEVAAWSKQRRGRVWRWWQRLAATRLFEIDVHGELVWETMLLTVARQVGKTWWLRDVCDWRLEHGERFGAEQLVLSTGKDLAVVREMQRPARMRAKVRKDWYHVREVNGQEEIEYKPDGSRWMVRSRDGVYGISASMATVDEAWKVPASAVDDGLVPTMVEQPQAQLLLVSTAHRRASALMIGRRATALEQLADPGDDGLLLVEWSAPRDSELTDVKAWRQASPHWTPKRERVIASRLAAAQNGESEDPDEPDPIESFRAQWLNQWPARRVPVERGELFLEADQWHLAACSIDSVGPLIIGVEDHHGRGACVAFCAMLPDGRWVLGGDLYQNRADAYRVASEAADARPGSTLVVGASLFADAEVALIDTYRTVRAGYAETAAALTNLRELLATGRVTQDQSPDLTTQALAARVTEGVSGLSLVPGIRSDLLRASAWGLRIAVTQPAPEPAIH